MAKVIRYGFTWDSDDVPELGTLDFVRTDENGLYEFMGVSNDSQYLSQLPTGIPTGSNFLALDTGELWVYLKTDETWYKM